MSLGFAQKKKVISKCHMWLIVRSSGLDQGDAWGGWHGINGASLLQSRDQAQILPEQPQPAQPHLPSFLSPFLLPSLPLFPPTLQGQGEGTESNHWSHLDPVRAGRFVGVLGLPGGGRCPEGRTSTAGDGQGGRTGKEQHLEAKKKRERREGCILKPDEERVWRRNRPVVSNPVKF